MIKYKNPTKYTRSPNPGVGTFVNNAKTITKLKPKSQNNKSQKQKSSNYGIVAVSAKIREY